MQWQKDGGTAGPRFVFGLGRCSQLWSWNLDDQASVQADIQAQVGLRNYTDAQRETEMVYAFYFL